MQLFAISRGMVEMNWKVSCTVGITSERVDSSLFFSPLEMFSTHWLAFDESMP